MKRIRAESTNSERQDKERRFWDKFALKYDSFLNHLKPAYAMIIERIISHTNPSMRILEIATGTGVIILEAAKHVDEAYGCDISPAMIKIARTKAENDTIANVTFSVCDACNLKFSPDSFDMVIASNTLHLLMQPEKALKEIHTVLKTGGLLIAPTYCHGNSLKSRIISGVMGLSGFKAYTKWSVGSFRVFLERNGFSIEEFDIRKDPIPLVFATAYPA